VGCKVTGDDIPKDVLNCFGKMASD